MKFITSEQFGKADEKVRDSIMEWWIPSEGDLTSGNTKQYDYIQVFAFNPINVKTIKSLEIPLLTMGQLIEFIEWKTEKRLEIGYNNYGFDDIRISLGIINEYTVEFKTNDLLQALWLMAQEVVSKNNTHKDINKEPFSEYAGEYC